MDGEANPPYKLIRIDCRQGVSPDLVPDVMTSLLLDHLAQHTER